MGTQEKTCFKCGLIKPLTEYYKHKRMGDGHLNKCKDCTKKDVGEREKKLRESPEWVEKEKIRAREKYRRLEYRDKYKPNPENKKIYIDNYNKNYPEKIKAQRLSSHVKPSVKGNQLHHWSYREEHAKDLIELSIRDHKKAHRYIVYDQEHYMYRRHDTMELLDTKDKHLEYINWCIKNKDD
jgi:hypothetical protein